MNEKYTIDSKPLAEDEKKEEAKKPMLYPRVLKHWGQRGPYDTYEDAVERGKWAERLAAASGEGIFLVLEEGVRARHHLHCSEWDDTLRAALDAAPAKVPLGDEAEEVVKRIKREARQADEIGREEWAALAKRVEKARAEVAKAKVEIIEFDRKKAEEDALIEEKWKKMSLSERTSASYNLGPFDLVVDSDEPDSGGSYLPSPRELLLNEKRGAEWELSRAERELAEYKPHLESWAKKWLSDEDAAKYR